MVCLTARLKNALRRGDSGRPEAVPYSPKSEARTPVGGGVLDAPCWHDRIYTWGFVPFVGADAHIGPPLALQILQLPPSLRRETDDKTTI